MVDDVQLSVFTGELELVDCELDGPKLTRLLARVGLRCRVVNARAAKVTVSLPITWRRGARIRVVVADPGASLELDDAEHDETPQKPRRALWRRLALRVAEAVDLEVRNAAARCLLKDGAACGIGLGSATIQATSPDGETWRKRVVISGLYAYTDEDAAEWDAQDAYALSAALVADAANALAIEENVVLEPASLTGSVALTRSSKGLRLDVEGRNDTRARARVGVRETTDGGRRASYARTKIFLKPVPRQRRRRRLRGPARRSTTESGHQQRLKNYHRRLPAGRPAFTSARPV